MDHRSPTHQASPQQQHPPNGLRLSTLSNVETFYDGRSVFITGATGFMGKVLVEKLLRSCTHMRTVYLLMRPKTGLDVEQRLEEMLSSRVYDNLKREKPEIFQKLVVTSGDISLPGLGLSTADEKTITENVSVVFHLAATVKFDEGLKRSIDMNVQGTRRLVDLCHKMSNLVSLVHVSTAYCNCNRDEIAETVYPMNCNPNKIIEAMEWMDDKLVTSITPQIVGDWPNSYTYTKALAENILLEECGNLPVAIVRPAIVVAAWKEPMPGWIDNINGPTGPILGCGKGVIRTLHCKGEMTVDLVPVDAPINLMISVAWYTATQKPDSVLIYNCTTGDINRLTWGDLNTMCYANFLARPLNSIPWYLSWSFKNSRLYNEFCSLFVHFLPAYCVDAGLWLTGNKPTMVKMHKKIRRAMNSLEYFRIREWHFTNDNFWMLWNSLGIEDKKIFNFDLRQIHWPTYVEQYCLGIKQYILKEDLSSLPAARNRLRKLFYVRQLTHLIGILVLWRLLMTRFAFAKRSWYVCVSLILRLVRLLPL